MISMSQKYYKTIKDHEKFGEELYAGLSADRKKTVDSIRQVSNYDDLNIYEMDVSFDYDLDKATCAWEHQPDTTEYMQHLINIAIPGSNIPYEAPSYGCSACTCVENDTDVAARLSACDADTDTASNNNDISKKPHVCMGRNYDFMFDSSAMCVRTQPSGGYKSISFAGLDHIYDNNPLTNKLAGAMSLTCPFVPLDGMNEKGLCVTVLTLDSEPTIHQNGRGVLMPGTLIRLLLDRAATTAEAVEILKNYDIFAISGRDYHYYITDANGDGRIVEYDPHTPERKMVVTPTNAITNFYMMYEDRVKPNQHNGIYGHGRERYDAINKVFDAHGGHGGAALAWESLKAAAQTPNPKEVTSNTQWSAVYNMTTFEVELSLHRRWDDIFKFKLYDK